MGRKHFQKYFQKYYLLVTVASSLLFLLACNATKKVPNGDFLLTSNQLDFQDGSLFSGELENAILQKPNKKGLLFFSSSLWMYNKTNPKYDTILAQYMAFPKQMRNQNLRDSLFIKNGHPEYVGNSLFWNRFFYSYGKPPVIWNNDKTEKTAMVLQKRLRNHGYWDAKVSYSVVKDSLDKKAKVKYHILHKDPTHINDYYYSIADQGIKNIYEQNFDKSYIKKGDVLDHSFLEKEDGRISDLMKDAGYYKFNNNNEEIHFTTDTIKSTKSVPLTLNIKRDSADTPYKIAKIGKIDLAIVDSPKDFPQKLKKDSLLGINFHQADNMYKNRALWRSITLKPGEVYEQEMLDLTKRNFLKMNNFSILKAKDSLRKDGMGEPGNDALIDVLYLLKPLPKFERKYAIDANYSQLLSFAFSPSVDLTTRNVFGGMENLSTSLTGVFGRIVDPADTNQRIWAYEISAQANLAFPKLLLPFQYYKFIPKRYSPTSTINLGMSVQKNIGMDRINFNAGLNYYANVSDRVVHKLTLFNTLLSLTQNKAKYYDYYVNENQIRLQVYDNYFLANPYVGSLYNNGSLTMDEVSALIFEDTNYQNSILGVDQINQMNSFKQSLINKDRLTQDVLISSILYDFTYNEMGKKEYTNPFYFNAKVELAGNVLSLFKPTSTEHGVTTNEQRTILNVPFSQFVKFDVDVRKYFAFHNGKNTLALRQFVGVGIPYGNSNSMPFVRSYFNGGSNDIRAWLPFGGLGPADSQLNQAVRTYIMDNVKLTTNIEYRIPLNSMYETAIFTDLGNIWSLKDNGFGDEFKFNKFYKQLGIGSGVGLRVNIAYVTLRIDLAYKIYDPNLPEGDRWRLNYIQPLKPTLNFAFFYPF